MEIHHHALKTISAFKIFQRDSTDFCSLFCLPAWSIKKLDMSMHNVQIETHL